MLVRMPLFIVAVIVVLAGGSRQAPAQQQVTVTAPLRRTGDRFFESTNVHSSFGMGGRTVARFGNPNAGQPAFGGFNPNAGIRGGTSVRNNGFGANLGFNFAQGSSRSMTTTAPVLTLSNGRPGSIFIGSRRPFVTGVVPVVGNGGGLPVQHDRGANTVAGRVLRGEVQLPGRGRNGNGEKRSPSRAPKTAARPAGRVITAPLAPSEIRRQQQAGQTANFEAARKNFLRGQLAEQNGKPQVARIYYRMAARKASGDLRESILKRLEAVNRSK